MTSKAKVLIVDDDPDTCEILALSMKDEGLETQICSDGVMANNLVRTTEFAALLVDIRLPRISGLQVASTAKSFDANRKTPIYIISGILDQDTVSRASALRVTDIIEKPFSAKDIASKVAKKIESMNKIITYDTRIINAFILASSEVFEFYFKEKPQLGKPSAKHRQGDPARGLVTGLIPFFGKDFAGSLALSVSGPFIKGLAQAVFPDTEVKFDQELVADMVAEMCNQVLGGAKAKFAKIGISISLGLPKTIMGKNHIIMHTVKPPILLVPLGKDDLFCDLEFCLDKRDVEIHEGSDDNHEEAGSIILFE